ncbi:glycosyltransferase [Clostridium sp. AM22-16AC]|nr:glycosyltransferase [Clostridium sp. AM22-16AC]
MNLRESGLQGNGLSENDQQGDTCQKGKIQGKNPQESQRQENNNQKVIFRVVRLPENGGLGKALNEGLKYCSCEWIARMDTDDLSTPDRCEKQLKFLEEHPEVDVVSGTIAEFQGDALDGKTAETAVISYKTVPETQKEIAAYIKQRNPINHPCVMLRKSRVESAGGYQLCPYFEDYDLWVRMYKNHAVFANLPDTLLYMRINGMHQRRGGIRYAKCVIDFRMKMYRNRVITFGEFLPMTVVRVLVSLMPNSLRRFLYEKKLRKQQ